MNIVDIQNFINGKDFEAGQAFIQKLFACRFITKGYNDDSRRLYQFGLSYRNELSTILSLCGFELSVHEGNECIYLKSETKVNRMKMSKDETIVYLRLLQAYKESITNLTSSGRKEAIVEISDLLNKINDLRLSNKKKEMQFQQLKEILKGFYHMQMIRLNKQSNETISTITKTSSIFVLSSINCIMTASELTEIDKIIQSLNGQGNTDQTQEDDDDSI